MYDTTMKVMVVDIAGNLEENCVKNRPGRNNSLSTKCKEYSNFNQFQSKYVKIQLGWKGTRKFFWLKFL